MGARIALEYVKEILGIHQTILDEDFSQMEFLNSREAVINSKGERVSKSYYYDNKIEVIRIEYFKVYGDFTYNGIVYPNTFLGIRKDKHWLLWDGLIHRTKNEKPEYFTLQPIDKNDLSKGFTSLFMRKIAREELNNLLI